MTIDIDSATLQGNTAEALAAIRQFLLNTAPHAFGADLDLQTPLLPSGALDSIGILQLTMFLADELDIEVADEDFVPENFDTVGTLVAFVQRKQGVTA